jgi:Cu/Zn superoxide dismutase
LQIWLIQRLLLLFAGVATIDITDTQIPLSGPNSVVGRAFVIHELKDDLGKGEWASRIPIMCWQSF